MHVVVPILTTARWTPESVMGRDMGIVLFSSSDGLLPCRHCSLACCEVPLSLQLFDLGPRRSGEKSLFCYYDTVHIYNLTLYLHE